MCSENRELLQHGEQFTTNIIILAFMQYEVREPCEFF